MLKYQLKYVNKAKLTPGIELNLLNLKLNFCNKI